MEANVAVSKHEQVNSERELFWGKNLDPFLERGIAQGRNMTAYNSLGI